MSENGKRQGVLVATVPLKAGTVETETMQIDPNACRVAFKSKDSRFDGKFFVGVVTTGIYCRPICPAPAPKDENVRFFASAAAAADAGLRPCLRCRPERAPGEASEGFDLARRAAAVLESGEIEDLNVNRLASALSVSTRHLARVFQEQVGASPGRVIATFRLQNAKRLLDDTSLSIVDVAFASGYGSLRRFNAAFRSTYGRSPSALRRSNDATGGERVSEFLLAYRSPFAWSEILEFLRPRCLAGVEEVSGECYRRVVTVRGTPGLIEVRDEPTEQSLRLRVSFSQPRGLVEIVERIRRVFDLRADPGEIRERLIEDERMRQVLGTREIARIVMTWTGFEAAVRAILGQAVSLAAARSKTNRVVAHLGERVELTGPDSLDRIFPTPEAVAACDSVPGLSQVTTQPLRDLARAVCDGSIVLDGSADPAEVRARLLEIHRIGPWTADYIALRGLGDPDAFPSSDLGLMKVSGLRAKELASASEEWRPWRGYAAMALWRKLALDTQR